MGLTRMKSSTDIYREKGRECHERAEQAASAADHDRWLALEKEGERLADDVDRVAKRWLGSRSHD